MMKVLVLGATGMLGHRLFWGLDRLGYRVVGGVRRDVSATHPYCRFAVFSDRSRLVTGVDAFDLAGLRAQVRAIQPDVILNCIGVIKQRGEGQMSVPCIALNALLPHVLEEIVSGWGGWLIHFSTDCVFKGDRGGYSEADPSDATDWYGRTKAMGEVQGSNALTLRTSIIGRELTGHYSLVDWFLSQRGGAVKGYSRAIYSGITTREMVHVIDLLLREHPQLRGLYQVASEPISKYELLCLIRDIAGLEIEIEMDKTTLCVDRSLSPERFFEATGYTAPAWPRMIAGLAEDIELYQSTFGIPAVGKATEETAIRREDWFRCETGSA
ncbi:SDR family oxidoreductase [Methylococcus capsulatus]|uniref:dTDP-4-dehydrorhamnose reductase family protein n=1 Tax=Methylococcus capsulatus TaxID=414 RepID=UPI002FD9E9F4